MKNEKKKLPIGIENFEEIQSAGFYYIDKSYLIKELKIGQSHTLYPSKAIWKVPEYEYVKKIL